MGIAVLIQIDGYDPVAASAITLTLSSVDDERVCALNEVQWWPLIAALATLSYDLFSGQFDGQVTTEPSSFSMSVEAWPNFGRYALTDARIQIWVGVAGNAWAGFTRRFDGRVTGQPAVSDGIASISFAVDDRWLDAPLLSVYAGTGGAEGVAAIKGSEKPLALGAPRYTGATLVDPVALVYQVSGYGAIEGFDAALDRLVRYGAPLADHASDGALIAATIAPGAWATCNAEGKARFGAPPFGKVSFLVKGDKAGADGWARTPGKMIRRLALLSGGAGKIDDPSLNALDTSRPYNLSLWIDRQTTARQVIQELAASVNAVAGVTWLGKLFCAPVGIGASVLTLAADGSALPPVTVPDQITIGAPFWRIGLAAERTWNLHGSGDYAAIDALPGTVDFSTQVIGNKPEASATAGGNLIYNGNAETGDTSGWSLGEIIGPVNFDVFTNSRSGKYAFAIQKPDHTSGFSGSASSRAIAAREGERFIVNASVVGSHNTSTGLTIRIQEKFTEPTSGTVDGSNRDDLQDVVIDGPVTLGWVDYRNLVYTVRAGVKFISLAVYNSAGGPALLLFEAAMSRQSDAILGENVLTASRAVVTDSMALNALQSWIQVNFKPSNIAALGGLEAIQNTLIALSGGNIMGIGAGNGTSVANSQFVQNADGSLAYFNGVSWINSGATTFAGLPGKSLAVTDAAAATKLGGIQPGADVTAQALPDIDGNLTWTIDANSSGTIATALPLPRRFKAMLGGVDVSSATSFVVLTTGLVAATVNNVAGADRGIVTLGRGTMGAGTISLTSTFANGAIKNVVIQVLVNRAAMTSPGGAAATSGIVGTNASFNATGFVAVTPQIELLASSSGTVKAAFDASYTAGAAVAGRAQIRVAQTSGGSAVTQSADTVGTAYNLNEEAGEVIIPEATYSGLTPSAPCFVQGFMRRGSGSGPVSPTGTLTAMQ